MMAACTFIPDGSQERCGKTRECAVWCEVVRVGVVRTVAWCFVVTETGAHTSGAAGGARGWDPVAGKKRRHVPGSTLPGMSSCARLGSTSLCGGGGGGNGS